MLRKLSIIFCVLCFGMMNAQDMLTIEDAIKTGLEKNYAVMISKNDKEIAKAQNNYGAAGMSPTVTLNGSLNLSSVNSHQEFATGVTQDRNGAASNNTPPPRPLAGSGRRSAWPLRRSAPV